MENKSIVEIIKNVLVLIFRLEKVALETLKMKRDIILNMKLFKSPLFLLANRRLLLLMIILDENLRRIHLVCGLSRD